MSQTGQIADDFVHQVYIGEYFHVIRYLVSLRKQESDVHALGTNEPAVKEAGLTFEVYPMPSSIVRK